MGPPLPLCSGWPGALGNMSSFVQLLKRPSDGSFGHLSSGTISVGWTSSYVEDVLLSLTVIEMALHLLVADHHLIGTAFGGKSVVANLSTCSLKSGAHIRTPGVQSW